MEAYQVREEVEVFECLTDSKGLDKIMHAAGIQFLEDNPMEYAFLACFNGATLYIERKVNER